MIGAGRLGTSLALALTRVGLRLVGFITRTAGGRTRAEALLGPYACPSLEILVGSRPRLYLVTVPDQALGEVAAELGGLLRETGGTAGPPTFVAHTSGATSVAVLSACAEAGAQTLALHPLQTFSDPRVGADRFAGAALAVTPGLGGPDSPATRFGFELARALGARPFYLPDSKRTLYHAAATLACNYFVTIEHQAERLFMQAGLPPDEALSMFLPLVEATLANISSQGTIQALTGPLSRGDIETVRAHLSTLETEAPRTVGLYRALGLATLDILRLRGELDERTISALAELLGGTEPRAGDVLRQETRPHHQ